MGDSTPSLLRRLRPLALALAVTIAAGTAGYMVIEGAGLFDALYMTVITITTVGYAEHVPLSTAGRAFTMALLLVGVGLLFYGFTVANEFLFSSASQLRRRQLMRTIDQLRDHVIVCGYGRVGQFAARSLRDSGRQCLVIEQDAGAVERAETDGFLAVLGDATEDETLRRIHVDTARGLLVCTGNDADNVFITLSARTMNPALEVVARASGPGNVEKLRRAGAKHVVSPYQAGGLDMANALSRSG
jgi:voltage-gated potassium channel